LPGWVRVFSLPTARSCPRAGAAKFLFAGGSECRLWPVARGFLFAGWLGASSHPKARVLPSPMAPQPLKPVDLRCPVAGGSESPQAGGLRCPVAGWLRISPSPKARRCPLPGGSGSPRARRPGDARCRVARGCPLAGWRRVSSVPVGSESPLGPRAQGFSRCRVAPEVLLPVARSPSFARWLGVSPFASGSGFPLRRLPFPVVKKFLRLFVRGAQEVCATNFKILWPSTSHPQLTPSCPPRQGFCPPNTPQRGPQAGRAGRHPRAGYRPANLSSGSRASLT